MKKILFLIAIIIASITACQTDNNKQEQIIIDTVNKDSIIKVHVMEKDSFRTTLLQLALASQDTIGELKKIIATLSRENLSLFQQLKDAKNASKQVIKQTNENASKTYANSGLLVERLTENLQAQEQRCLNTVNSMQSKIDGLSEENLKIMNELAECQFKLNNKEDE